jgi:hypothetical protein
MRALCNREALLTAFDVVRVLLQGADRATTKHAKGKAFEDLVCQLFVQIPGIVNPQRNKRNIRGREEIDLAFWNEQDPAGLKSLNAMFLVECKNWSSAVGCSDVNWFIRKIEDRGLDFGVLVAANGITGSAEERTDAHDVVSKALARRIRIIVITRAEIELLDSGDALVRLIKDKLCQLTVSGTVWP